MIYFIDLSDTMQSINLLTNGMFSCHPGHLTQSFSSNYFESIYLLNLLTYLIIYLILW